MNRKIFTLLAGTFLMLAAVFNASAQTSAITTMPLQLGEPVTKLKLGANEFYHLVVTDVSPTTTSTTAPYAPTTNVVPLVDVRNYPIVLYMGKHNANHDPGTYPIFLEGLGQAGNQGTGYAEAMDIYGSPTGGANATWVDWKWFDQNAPKSQESASSLWCTVVNDYGGQNITFDFTNKFVKNQLLEVSVNGYEGWTDFLSKDGRHTSNYYNYLPGNVSGWNFSRIYKQSVEVNRPLFSYITADTVAVLCTYQGSYAKQEIGAVYVKIAAVKDVLANAVPDMLYFTLYNAAPFALDSKDFNTMMGSKTSEAARKLTFNPDVSSGITNQFTQDPGLLAEPIADISGFTPYEAFPTLAVPKFGTTSLSPIDPGGAGYVTTYKVSPLQFDKYGYIYLTNGKTGTDKKYLYVTENYYPQNAGVNQNLIFGWRNLFSTTPTVKDTFLYTQSIWRLIYYPSSDSIYINPYSATYLPTWDSRLMYRDTTKATSPSALIGKEIVWTDSLTQSDNFYTFRANPVDKGLATAALDATTLGTAFIAGSSGFTAADYQNMVGRLKYIQDPAQITAKARYPFYNFHQNYVTIQNLTTGVKIVTLGHGTNPADHQIDTYINFGNYSPCSGTDNSGRITVAQDLYLIRNELGQYLYVPLYSATDSAEWVDLEPSVHPELLPSFQWVVLKQNTNSATSYITLTNREFDGLVYGPIQVWNKSRTGFDMLGKNFNWNNKPVNGNVVDFAKLTKLDKSTFVKLGKAYKNDKYMGYTFVDSITAKTNIYSLNFGSGIDPNVYVSWNGDYRKYPNTDTTVYVYGIQDYEKLYFKLDTVTTYPLEQYGWAPDTVKTAKTYIADLVQLVRQPYQLNVEDPYKFLCNGLFHMSNGSQSEYAMSTAVSDKGATGIFRNMIGIPVFNLRNFYHKDINGDGKLEAYNALVQRIDEATLQAQKDGFEDYLTTQYGSQAAGEVINILNGGDPQHMPVTSPHNSWFRTGVMVAQFDDQTSKLKAQLRADNVTRVSTFRLAQDEDPIYRRFNKLVDADVANDAPKVLKFHSIQNSSYELFENTGMFPDQKRYWDYSGAIGAIQPIGQKNYLGSVHILQHPDASTAIYVDTAYINRPGGEVKPQYMLVVNPQSPGGKDACDEFGNPIPQDNNMYLRGRYLINATDSARGVAPAKDKNNVIYNSVRNYVDPKTGDEVPEYSGKNYLWDTSWERLVFVDAVHVYGKDALYFANWPGVTLDQYTNTLGVIDTAKLDKASAPLDGPTTATKPIRKVALGNNNHKDAVFQMRMMFRGTDDFMIESETGNGKVDFDKDNNVINTFGRKWGISYGQLNSNGPIWKPCYGGWVKVQNMVPVISRSDVVFGAPQALGFNTTRTTDLPTSNDKVAVSAVTVIGGNDAVTILNAAGKKVVVSNVLGQTVASTVLTSDNVTLAAPAGVVVVAVEGSAPVKALVK